MENDWGWRTTGAGERLGLENDWGWRMTENDWDWSTMRSQKWLPPWRGLEPGSRGVAGGREPEMAPFEKEPSRWGLEHEGGRSPMVGRFSKIAPPKIKLGSR